MAPLSYRAAIFLQNRCLTSTDNDVDDGEAAFLSLSLSSTIVIYPWTFLPFLTMENRQERDLKQTKNKNNNNIENDEDFRRKDQIRMEE